MYNYSSISSALGNWDCNYSGIYCNILYSLTPIDLFISFKTYSAVNLSLLLHRSSPILGLSVLAFTKSSIADK